MGSPLIWVPRTAPGERDPELGDIRQRAKRLLGARRNLYAIDADAFGNTCVVGLFTAPQIEFHVAFPDRQQIELARGRTWDEALKRARLAIERGAARGVSLTDDDPPAHVIAALKAKGGR